MQFLWSSYRKAEAWVRTLASTRLFFVNKLAPWEILLQALRYVYLPAVSFHQKEGPVCETREASNTKILFSEYRGAKTYHYLDTVFHIVTTLFFTLFYVVFHNVFILFFLFFTLFFVLLYILIFSLFFTLFSI
jgi:hypothetical protein